MITTPTPQRQFLETTLLPRWAASFAPSAFVLNLGAGRHAYREHFGCTLRTADRAADAHCDETFQVEAIPYRDNVIDGILFNGVFDRLDDPMQAMRECRRVLKPTGTMLLGLAGLDFEWHADRDRWRVTPGGAQYVIREFRVLEAQAFGRVYYFYVLGK
jgi:SAM-dependent methyltransferase